MVLQFLTTLTTARIGADSGAGTLRQALLDAQVSPPRTNSEGLVNGADAAFLIHDFFAGTPKPAP